jgi:curved DNA-binding protein CbpA
MDTLDDHGKMLYDNYIKARNEWTNYIAPIAQNYIRDLLSKANKKYYRFDYLFAQYGYKVTEDITSCDNSEKPENIKKLYRKLSLLFHPDKFKTNENLFKFIKTQYDNNDITKLSKINEDIDILLDFSYEQIEDYIKCQSTIVITEKQESAPADYDYTTTIQYQMFIKNNINIKDYYSPEELINHIENDFILDSEMQYYVMNKDMDDNIRIGLEKLVIKKDKELAQVRKEWEESKKKLEEAQKRLDEIKNN